MPSKRSKVPWLIAAGLLFTLPGCKDPGTLTDSFLAQGPGDVDMLWIIDNSKSMADAQGQLTRNFSAFVEVLPENSTTQMAITTTQAWPCSEADFVALCDDTVGTAGRIRHHEGHAALLDPTDEGDREDFEELAHVGIHGIGFERPFQAALMAICEAVDLPQVSDFVLEDDSLDDDFPHGCSGEEWDTDHPYYEACHCLPYEILETEDPPEYARLHAANFGLLRSDNPLHLVVVTDEGDKTSELDNYGGADCEEMTGDELCDCRLDHYLDLIRTVVPSLHVSVIGPGQGPSASEDIRYNCNPMDSDSCGLDFFFNATTLTDGAFSPILEYDEATDSCEEAELAPALADLVLHHPAIEWFRLTAIPEEDTIAVTLNDQDTPNYDSGGSCVTDGITTGGWTYDSEKRGVSIIGDCAAVASDTVKITYVSAGPVLVL